MGAKKIGDFYDDPIKRAYDTHSIARAYSLRSLSIEPGFAWLARRWSRFLARLGIGTLRRLRERVVTFRLSVRGTAARQRAYRTIEPK